MIDSLHLWHLESKGHNVVYHYYDILVMEECARDILSISTMHFLGEITLYAWHSLWGPLLAIKFCKCFSHCQVLIDEVGCIN